MAPQIKYGDTYFSTYQGIVGLRVFRPGFITIHDHNQLGLQSPLLDQWLVEFQPWKDPHQYHDLDEQHIREACASDFQVGDIIMENALFMFNCEIIEVKTVKMLGLTDSPIVAEQLEDDGTRTGNIFHLEPYECIMVSKLNEDTLDLKLSKLSSPANNQGLDTCFWCGGKTIKSPGFTEMYDMCPKCKK